MARGGIPEGRIKLEAGQFGWDYVLRAWDGRTRLIQTDWDYPGVASSFGWRGHKHGETDGTVDCPTCGRKAGDMIADAQKYLDRHVGKVVRDPGYFDADYTDEELDATKRGGKRRGLISEGPRFTIEALQYGAWVPKGAYHARELAVEVARDNWTRARMLDPAGAVVWPPGGGKGRRPKTAGKMVGDITVNEARWLLRPILVWMGQNLHQWAVVDVLKDFTTWGFWQDAGGQAYAIINADIARQVLAKLRAFVREAPDRDVIEVWDRLAHYEAHARVGGKRRSASHAVVDPSTGRRRWLGRRQKPTPATGRRLDALVRQLTQMTKE